MNAKPIWKSKTFWLNLVALLAMAIPAVQAWLAANPETFVAVLGAVNILLRFVTSGGISIFEAGAVAGDDNNGAGTGMSSCWLIGVAAAGLLGVATLPSCTAPQIEAARQIPVKACWVTQKGTVCYSSKAGIEVSVDSTSGK